MHYGWQVQALSCLHEKCDACAAALSLYDSLALLQLIALGCGAKEQSSLRYLDWPQLLCLSQSPGTSHQIILPGLTPSSQQCVLEWDIIIPRYVSEQSIGRLPGKRMWRGRRFLWVALMIPGFHSAVVDEQEDVSVLPLHLFVDEVEQFLEPTTCQSAWHSDWKLSKLISTENPATNPPLPITSSFSPSPAALQAGRTVTSYWTRTLQGMD